MMLNICFQSFTTFPEKCKSLTEFTNCLVSAISNSRFFPLIFLDFIYCSKAETISLSALETELFAPFLPSICSIKNLSTVVSVHIFWDPFSKRLAINWAAKYAPDVSTATSCSIAGKTFPLDSFWVRCNVSDTANISEFVGTKIAKDQSFPWDSYNFFRICNKALFK